MIKLTEIASQVIISEHLRYHIDNKVSIHDNIFRYGSEGYCNLMLEAKRLLSEGKLSVDVFDVEVLKTDIRVRM